MERCRGKTKAGARCKRSASANSQFCSLHADQAKAAESAAESAAGPTGDGTSPGQTEVHDPLDTIIAAAALGVVVFAALTLRRLFRFL